ncbi:hypothetical protein GCM10009687_73400 [Asanoa iriomotensis]|uniref:Uncharacterized protein n=1 Tax=Asanoa iriomotensis TaxID=234613 RepID=A0ABQ4BW48_9ACTN|nr:hypothetical protein Air01nite_08480 [Asanoa iriomotensis]
MLLFGGDPVGDVVQQPRALVSRLAGHRALALLRVVDGALEPGVVGGAHLTQLFTRSRIVDGDDRVGR